MDQFAPCHTPEDARRLAILRSARASFLAHGFNATRVEPIARAASVSTATLYEYFPSKDHLFAAVIETGAADFAACMAQVVHGMNGTAREQITPFALAYAEFIADALVRAIFRLVMTEQPRFRAMVDAFVAKARAEFGAPLIACIERMSEAGELRIDKPSWAAGQLLGMIEHPILLVPLLTGGEAQPVRPREQIAHDAVDTFMARYGIA